MALPVLNLHGRDPTCTSDQLLGVMQYCNSHALSEIPLISMKLWVALTAKFLDDTSEHEILKNHLNITNLFVLFKIQMAGHDVPLESCQITVLHLVVSWEQSARETIPEQSCLVIICLYKIQNKNVKIRGDGKKKGRCNHNSGLGKSGKSKSKPLHYKNIQNDISDLINRKYFQVPDGMCLMACAWWHVPGGNKLQTQWHVNEAASP